MESRKLFLTTILLFGIGIFSQLFAQKFDFNGGTQQGWTMQGACDENFNGPYPSNFSVGWTKLVNYPTPDPNSTKGSLYVYTPGGHGITGSSGNYWIQQLISPVGPTPPEKYSVIPPGAPLFYDIGTTATYSGNIKINIQYNDAGFGGDQEMQFKLHRYDEPQKQWTDITTSKDIQNNIIGGETTHLSVSAIMYTSGSSAGGTLVTNCDDSGPGSLRNAIESANSNVGPDTINFAILKGVPGHDANDGVWRIFPQSELPGITGHQLIINGFSQREFIGEDSNPSGPEIVINGANAGQYVSGLVVRASGVTIMGLTINNFYNIGIWMDYVDGGGIFGCYVGTDLSGMEPMPNGFGIWIGNRCKYIVVAPMDTFRNVISGNTNGGIVVADTSRHVSIIGNIIGLNRKTSGSMGNGNYGGIFIQELSDSNAVFDNWIGGNKYGIYIYKSSRNNIETNWIGKTPLHPDLDLGNDCDGVYLANKSFDNRILDNVIWFNKTGGVRIYGDKPFGNRISHNSISRNGWGGIIFDSAGANKITAPTITDITGSSVSGTAIPNATIEIYTDDGNQGDIFQGETVSGSNGKFTWVGNIYGPYSNVTAIAIDPAGNTSAFSKVVVVKVAEETNAMNAPRAFSLSQNYPNPFNPETAIEFQLPQPSEIEISIFNLQGQKITTLVNSNLSAGEHKVAWNGTDESGRAVTSGVYLCQMRAGDRVETKKLLLLR